MSFSEKIAELLLKAGLSESETIIYLELLKSPASTKWELINRTQLGKNKVYRACERLSLDSMTSCSKPIKAKPISSIIAQLQSQTDSNKFLIEQLKQISPMQKIPEEAISEISVTNDKDQILDNYIKMSQVNCETCLDFGDLEGFVKVLGGLDPVFKFRKNRFKQNAKNLAICTTAGPFTDCMARREDMKKYKAKIKNLNLGYKNRWIIFSDTHDYLMINDFSNPEMPSSTILQSKTLADQQRANFDLTHRLAKKL